MSNFAMVIQYKFENEEQQAIVLDTIDDNTVNSNANVTSQPLVTGDYAADHMYRQPKTMSVSGVCSLNGSQGIVINKAGSKLANFEDLFERIQKEGVKCTLYKISIENEKDIRFKQRQNMVLQSISFTERINSLNFTLDFVEVISIDVATYDVDTDDEYLPNVTEPKTLSFTDELINWSDIDAAVIKILDKEQLWDAEFKTFLSSMGQATLASILTGAAAVTLAVIITALGTNPVGWTVAAVGLAIASVVIFVKGIIDAIDKAKRRRKYAIEKFEYFNNEKKDAQELQRFSDFINGIHNEFQAVNDKIHVFRISENTNQEAMVSIGDDYFIFTFTKNNTTGQYSLHIENIDKSITKEMPDISTAITNFGDANSTNYLVKAKNNSRVYLIVGDNSQNDAKTTIDKSDLTNYFIVVCDFDPSKFNDIINDIINSHIYREAAK